MTDIGNAKYMIRVNVKLDGQGQRKDIIGAIFGQTEGLMPEALDLRKLQRSGRIGHIDVTLESKKGRVSGLIEIPSTLENVESAIIGAALETIERIGPSKASLKVTEIINIRSDKRLEMVERAKDLLLDIVNMRDAESGNLIEEVRSVLTTSEVTVYGDSGMTCGPNVEDSDALIIVEGRNDVLNLAKSGIKNAIAVMGSGVPDELVELASGKAQVTAFLDGDRGGKMIALELAGALEKSLTRIAFAPPGREVEYLEKKLVGKHLGQAEAAIKVVRRLQADVDRDNARGKGKGKASPRDIPDEIKGYAEQMPAARKAVFILEDGSVSDAICASKIAEFGAENEGAQALVINSSASARVVDIANDANNPVVVATKSGGGKDGVEVYGVDELA
ncbi:MAG: DNA primase DnaG [Candidatus Poseidoniales archaeon]|nr:DNA primase DnaG [Candidatus Poseidoniales archaeon]